MPERRLLLAVWSFGPLRLELYGSPDEVLQGPLASGSGSNNSSQGSRSGLGFRVLGIATATATATVASVATTLRLAWPLDDDGCSVAVNVAGHPRGSFNGIHKGLQFKV